MATAEKRLRDETVSLDNLGIDKTQSHRWQLLASMDAVSVQRLTAAPCRTLQCESLPDPFPSRSEAFAGLG